MINQPSDMALAFLQYQPGSAARILEQQPIEAVAEFIKSVPYTQAAFVLKKMLPQYTARMSIHLEPEVSAAFLSEMDTNLTSAILRYTPKDVRRKILNNLPERIKLTCSLLLNYPETAVGAWMITDFLALPDDCDVQEALHRLALSNHKVGLDTLYITNRDRKLLGTVSITHLLRMPENKLIKTLMQAKPPCLSGHASLTSAMNNPIWDDQDSAAVINEKRHIVGVLRHLELRQGLKEIATTIKEPTGNDPIGGLWEAYGQSLLALFNTVGDAINTNATNTNTNNNTTNTRGVQ